MVPTNLVGSDDSLVLYSGDAAVFDEHRATLQVLGGGAVLLGDDAGLAAAYDLAMLDIFFNGMAAFLHAVARSSAPRRPGAGVVPLADRPSTCCVARSPGSPPTSTPASIPAPRTT